MKKCQLCVSPVNYSDSYSETAEILSRWSYTLLQYVSGQFSLASILEAVYQYLVPIPTPVTDSLLFLNQRKREKCPQMNVTADIGTTCIQTGHPTAQTTMIGFCLFIMPPTLKKLMGHIAFGACVGGWVRHIFCTYCNFKILKARVLKFHIWIPLKK